MAQAVEPYFVPRGTKCIYVYINVPCGTFKVLSAICKRQK